MPVPKPVTKLASTKKATTTSGAAAKKVSTAKKSSCDISYPFGSPYYCGNEGGIKETTKFKTTPTIVEENSRKSCYAEPVSKVPVKSTTIASSKAGSIKTNLTVNSAPKLKCYDKSCYEELSKKTLAKKATNAVAVETQNKATVKKTTINSREESMNNPPAKKPTISKEKCNTKPRKTTQSKSTTTKTTESAVMKLMLPTTRKTKTDCASGWCNWDSDMSTDGSDGCACGMCPDSDYDEEICHLQPTKKVPAKRASKAANQKCYLYK